MPLTDSEITEIGTIRAEDLARFALATPRLKRFLNGVEYSVATGQYLRNGQPVPYSEITALLELEQQSLTRRFEAATAAYIAGEITLQEWERRLADDSKTGFVIIALFVFGGALAMARNPTSGAVWATVGATLRSHIGGISGYGQLLDDEARSIQQLGGYVGYKARALQPLFAQLRKDNAIAQGYNEGRRFLDPTANHCPQCPGHQRTDWVPISEIVPVGVDCACRGFCRCRVVYRLNPSLIG